MGSCNTSAACRGSDMSLSSLHATNLEEGCLLSSVQSDRRRLNLMVHKSLQASDTVQQASMQLAVNRQRRAMSTWCGDRKPYKIAAMCTLLIDCCEEDQ